MQKITSNDEFLTIIREKKSVLAIFKGDNCSDCSFIEPFLPKIDALYPTVDFVLISKEEVKDLFKLYRVMGIPSFIFFHKGTPIMNFISPDRKTEVEITNFIESCLAKIEE